MSQSDDLEAINKFIMGAKIKTKAADKLRTEWLRWWEKLGWYDKAIESDTYDLARNKRNAFNRANAATAKEKAAVESVITGGVTAEETRGGTRRTTSDGNYLEDPEEKEPFVPTRIKVVGAIGLVAVGALWMAKKTYLAPLLRAIKIVT